MQHEGLLFWLVGYLTPFSSFFLLQNIWLHMTSSPHLWSQWDSSCLTMTRQYTLCLIAVSHAIGGWSSLTLFLSLPHQLQTTFCCLYLRYFSQIWPCASVSPHIFLDAQGHICLKAAWHFSYMARPASVLFHYCSVVWVLLDSAWIIICDYNICVYPYMRHNKS